MKDGANWYKLVVFIYNAGLAALRKVLTSHVTRIDWNDKEGLLLKLEEVVDKQYFETLRKCSTEGCLSVIDMDVTALNVCFKYLFLEDCFTNVAELSMLTCYELWDLLLDKSNPRCRTADKHKKERWILGKAVKEFGKIRHSLFHVGNLEITLRIFEDKWTGINGLLDRLGFTEVDDMALRNELEKIKGSNLYIDNQMLVDTINKIMREKDIGSVIRDNKVEELEQRMRRYENRLGNVERKYCHKGIKFLFFGDCWLRTIIIMMIYY